MENQAHKKFLKSFGENLKRLRKEHQISGVQMAFEMGTDEKQLRLIESGDINTGILSIYKIAQILNIPPKELLDF